MPELRAELQPFPPFDLGRVALHSRVQSPDLYFQNLFLAVSVSTLPLCFVKDLLIFSDE